MTSSTPPPPASLRVRVQLPERSTLFENGVHQLELVLQFGNNEQQILTIDIHEDRKFIVVPKQEMLDIPTTDDDPMSNPEDSSTVPSSPLSSSSNSRSSIQNVEGNSLDDPHPPSPTPNIHTRKKLKPHYTLSTGNKQFSTKQSLTPQNNSAYISTKEKKAVTKIEGQGNKCYFCQKGFQAPYLLSRHFVVHTRERPFPCDKCSIRCSHRSNLTTHLRIHDPDPAIRRPFHCTQCGKSFTQSSSLTTHVKMVHLKRKDFKCLQCGQKFSIRSDMEVHYNNVHLRIRHPCRKRNCDKTFSTKRYLGQHLKKAHPRQKLERL